jgi:hypothetical protein
MKSIFQKSFGLLQVFAALLGLELFMVYLLDDSGVLALLFTEDRSYLSRLILSIYGLASLHILLVAYLLSRETLGLDHDTPGAAGSHVRQYFMLLRQPSDDSDETGNMLLDALDGRCRGRFRFGYVISDLLLKLGLLGTIIGFIFMLGSLVDLRSIDISVMQKLLGEMSGGMKVALYTTLTGMSCGVLLNMKYQLLDWHVDNLLDDIRELTYRLNSR